MQMKNFLRIAFRRITFVERLTPRAFRHAQPAATYQRRFHPVEIGVFRDFSQYIDYRFCLYPFDRGTAYMAYATARGEDGCQPHLFTDELFRPTRVVRAQDDRKESPEFFQTHFVKIFWHNPPRRAYGAVNDKAFTLRDVASRKVSYAIIPSAWLSLLLYSLACAVSALSLRAYALCAR